MVQECHNGQDGHSCDVCCQFCISRQEEDVCEAGRMNRGLKNKAIAMAEPGCETRCKSTSPIVIRPLDGERGVGEEELSGGETRGR